MTTLTESRRLGRPTKDEAAHLAERLFDEAYTAFCSQGFAAASIEGIASACGIGKNTIYRRFPDKEALFKAVIEREVREFDVRVARAAAEIPDALEALRVAARAVSIQVGQAETLQISRLLISEATRFPGLAQLLDHWLETCYRQLDGLISEAVRQNRLADRPTEDLRQALVMLVATPALDQWILPDRQRVISDEEFAIRWSMFLEGCASRASDAP